MNNAPTNSSGGQLGITNEDGSAVALNDISTFLNGKATDADGDPIGMAVIAADPGWEFKEGGLWKNFTRPGELTETNALLIPPGTEIRYVPPKDFYGTAKFTYKAWDQTSGDSLDPVGQDTTISTAFSTASQDATVNVSPVNDAPFVASSNLAALFDGGDDYVDLGTATFGGEITIETWAYVEDPFRTWIRFAEFAGPNINTNQNILFGMESDTGKLFYGVYNGVVVENNYASETIMPTAEWAHIAVTHSASEVNIYLNGAKVFTQASAELPVSTERPNMYIGKSNYPQDNLFNGSQKDFIIWNKALSPEDILASYQGQVLTGNEAGLLGYYPLTGSVENLSNDSNAFSDTTLVNGASFVAEPGDLSSVTGEEDAAFISLAGMRIEDADDGDLNVNLSIPSTAGTFTLDTFGNLTVTYNSAAEISLTGTKADINAALETLKLTPTADFNGVFDLSYSVTDLGGGAGSQNSQVISGTRNIVISSVNDAPPVIHDLDGDAASVGVNEIAFLDSDTANNITDVDTTTDYDTGTLVITTTGGVADGNFSLDGINATSGGDSTLAANDAIVVGGTTIGTVHATNEGQGGNTLTITLNNSTTNANVSQLIQNIGYASATTGIRTFILALSESDGAIANASMTVEIDINPIIKGQSSISVNEEASVNINGFTVSDDDNPASLKIKMDVDHGNLLLATTTGITGTMSGASLEFSGSITDLNTTLNSLSYQGDAEYSGTDEITIQVSDDDGATWHGYAVDEVGKFYSPLNQHYYEFVSAPGITWTDAKTAAEAKTLYGLNGYLTTVTSAAENTFIAPKLGGQGWMGANDANVEGAWFWMTGPESGTQFWSGTGGGSIVGGQYNNWASGEPNNSGSNEDHAHFLTNGEWNDFKFDNGSITGYVVEYGGNGTGNDGFGSLQSVPLEVTIDSVNDAPVLNNLAGDTASSTVNQVAFLDTGTENSITDADATDFDGGTLVITTTSGTADGNFSLDGTNATTGGDSIIAANDAIAVGATNIGIVHATNDGQGGNTLTITLNGSATLSNVSQLIKNIGYASATVGVRDFNLALSESDGKTDNAVLSVQVSSGVSGGGSSSGSGSDSSSSTTIDGVSVGTSTNTNGGVTTSTTTIPIITPTRPEDASTQNATRADIPLVTDNDNQAILQVSLPDGVGLTSQDITGTATTLREKLIAAADPKIDETQVFDEILQQGIDAYVETVSDESQVTLRTITFTVSDSVADQPIIITGALGTGEDNLDNPLRQEALVIDTGNLPPNTELQFDDIEFAIIIGSGRIVGGEGRNFVVGDGANQFIVLGAEDDQLSGGFGDDTIGSKGGDDQLFGDEGNDYLIGGTGDDTLDGGEGDDLLQGGQSDAGTWTFSLNDQDRVVSTFTIKDVALSTASTIITQLIWFSNNVPITNDSRVSFVYQDSKLLETISTLYQAVLGWLPTTKEIDDWAQQGLTDLELSEIAYQAYLNTHSDMSTEPLETQMTQLISQVWDEDQVNDDWVNLGVEHINNGGSWGDVLLFMARHDNLKNSILDNNGSLKLTQNLQTSETGWSSDTGNDTLIGGQGDDTLLGGRGHNLLDGGPGVDAVVVTETADSHHIVINRDGRISAHRDGENAIDDLIDVEHLVFSDQTLDVSASNIDPAVLRDIAGLAHLIDETTLTLANLNQVNDAGLMAVDVAEMLMAADSYSKNWGVLSNSDFTNKLGDAVSETALTDIDLSLWNNQLNQGVIGRSEILVIAVGVADYQDTLFGGEGLLLL